MAAFYMHINRAGYLVFFPKDAMPTFHVYIDRSGRVVFFKRIESLPSLCVLSIDLSRRIFASMH